MRKLLLSGWVGLLFTGLFAFSAAAGELRVLPGHVPKAVSRNNLRPTGRLAADKEMSLIINLPVRNAPQRDQLFRQIYNPASTNFHRYLTPDQYDEQFAPSAEDYQKVVHFAESNGFTVTGLHDDTRSLVEAQARVADVERAFHIQMQEYQHPTEDRKFFAPDTEPTVDSNMPIESVGGLNNYIIPHPLGSGRPVETGAGSSAANGAGGSGGGLLLGSDYRHAYVPGTTLTGAGQTVGVFEYNGYNLNDIQTYEANAHYARVTLQNVLLNGLTQNVAPSPNDVEISGDIENVIAMAPGLSAVNVYEGSYGADDTGATIFLEMAKPTKSETLPCALSCSWGFNPTSSTSNYFVRFAVQGQSFFLASGDGGAYPTESGDDTVNEHAEPDVTMVGGTELTMTNSGEGWQTESVWNNPSEGGQFSSAGGVEVNAPIPDYQTTVNMSANKGSTQHRNVPDVAMAADQIEVVLTVFNTNNNTSSQATWTSWGTSFASPLWAGLAALADQQAAQDGKPNIGFINPAVYGIGESSDYGRAFHDITTGNNEWSNSPTLYKATTGYDLCTGWGSPRSPSLLNILTSFGGPTFVDFNYSGSYQNGQYDNPYNTMAKGTNAVQNNGTIIIRSAGTSSETMTISKPMTITSPNGASSIGN